MNSALTPGAGGGQGAEVKMTREYKIFKKYRQKYHDLGLIPFPASKKHKGPLVKWREDLPPPCTDDYEEWDEKYPGANIWVLLGPGYAVIDPDGLGAEKFVQSLNLPKCPTSISGKKSIHRWFRVSRPVDYIKATNGKDETFLELRTGKIGMFVPPSIHPETGEPYRWLEGHSPWEIPFPELPEEALQKIRALVSEPEPPRLERPTSDTSLGPLDVGRYLDHYGIKYVVKIWKDATIYALEKCLFADHHTTPDHGRDSGIIQGADGKLAYQCFHTHCSMRTWQDARQAISGNVSLAEFCSGYVPRVRKTMAPIKECPSAFPEYAMGGLAADFADLYSSYMEPSRVFFYFAFLSCMGNVLSGRLTLASEISPQPRFYTILLGESGDDRKSTALGAVIGFFQRYFPAAFNVCHGVGSAEGLQQRMKAYDGRLVLVYDEFKAFISKCKIEASVLLPCVNTLFESNWYESRTKKTDIRLDNAHLSLLGASTVQTYENIWTSQFTDIGFHTRLFLVPGSSQKRFAIPRQIPEIDKRALAERMASILRQTGDHLEMEVTSEAMDVFERWYLNLESSPHSKRIDTYALRLMPLLAINEGKAVVDVETVRKVITIMDWQLEVRRQLDPIDAESQVARMEEKVRRALRNGPMTERDLKRAVHYDRAGIWIYSQAVKNLSQGRARDIWFDGKSRAWKLMK